MSYNVDEESQKIKQNGEQAVSKTNLSIKLLQIDETGVIQRTRLSSSFSYVYQYMSKKSGIKFTNDSKGLYQQTYTQTSNHSLVEKERYQRLRKFSVYVLGQCRLCCAN